MVAATVVPVTTVYCILIFSDGGTDEVNNETLLGANGQDRDDNAMVC